MLRRQRDPNTERRKFFENTKAVSFYEPDNTRKPNVGRVAAEFEARRTTDKSKNSSSTIILHPTQQ